MANTFNDPSFVQYGRPRHGDDPQFERVTQMQQGPTMYMLDYAGNHNYVHSPGFVTQNIDSTTFNATRQRHADQQTIENFLQEVEQCGDASNNITLNKKSKIATTRHTLTSVSKLKEKIESVCAELKNNLNLLEPEWQEKINTCNELKRQISSLLATINDPIFIAELKKDVEKRKRKRKRDRVKKEKWSNEKTLRIEKRARFHAEADLWIRSKQAEIEKEKQEENLRKDADMILSDVRGKRNDARKYLGLLHELQNLRNVKLNIARARGEHLSSAADEAFNNIIVKLTEQWAALDREYSLEEQGLKLMLKTDNEQRIEKQKRNILDEWENVLFGRKIVPNQYHTDWHSFVLMRTAWDKYISHDSDSSSIPIGWIVPDKPSSAAWQKCLKRNVS